MAVPLLASVGGSILKGGISSILSGRAASDARDREARLMKQIAELEKNRQAIINPFGRAESILSNPFANMPVATRAAEMQAQQTDLSLASTLDTLRAIGAGSGGATALANAALSGKQGVAASIQQQEVQNARLRAQGEAQLQRQLLAADASGKQFMFKAREEREMAKLDRLSSLASAASQQAATYRSQQLEGFGQLAGGVGTAVGGMFGTKEVPAKDAAGNVIPGKTVTVPTFGLKSLISATLPEDDND